MYQLIIKPKAIVMAKEAYRWYEDQQIGLGDMFLQELNNCYDKLEIRPESYGRIKNDFRQIILRTFPYVVVFELFDEQVIVYSVFHTRRSPKKKFKR